MKVPQSTKFFQAERSVAIAARMTGAIFGTSPARLRSGWFSRSAN
jgi:hypothetical protein